MKYLNSKIGFKSTVLLLAALGFLLWQFPCFQSVSIWISILKFRIKNQTCINMWFDWFINYNCVRHGPFHLVRDRLVLFVFILFTSSCTRIECNSEINQCTCFCMCGHKVICPCTAYSFFACSASSDPFSVKLRFSVRKWIFS